MKKQREKLLTDLRQKIQDDDITKHVLLQRQENHKVINTFLFLQIKSLCFLRIYFLNK
jgi:hypothetical protein